MKLDCKGMRGWMPLLGDPPIHNDVLVKLNEDGIALVDYDSNWDLTLVSEETKDSFWIRIHQMSRYTFNLKLTISADSLMSAQENAEECLENLKTITRRAPFNCQLELETDNVSESDSEDDEG